MSALQQSGVLPISKMHFHPIGFASNSPSESAWDTVAFSFSLETMNMFALQHTGILTISKMHFHPISFASNPQVKVHGLLWHFLLAWKP